MLPNPALPLDFGLNITYDGNSLLLATQLLFDTNATQTQPSSQTRVELDAIISGRIIINKTLDTPRPTPLPVIISFISLCLQNNIIILFLYLIYL